MRKELVPQAVPLPQEVHPGIKFCRWVFLLAGIFHGVEKLNRLKIYDAPIREREKIMNEITRKRLAREKAIAIRGEIAALELLFLDDPGPIEDMEETYDEKNFL